GMEDQLHFGQDIFNHHENLLPQRYYLPTGSFLTSEELFLSGSGYDDGRHYSLTDASTESGNATEEEFNAH
ncbi:LTA synthase family protein, partial [Paenibacillus septentrionalis]